MRSRFQIRASSFQISPDRILSGAEFRFLVATSGSERADFWTQISHFTFPTSSSRSSLEVEAPSISRFSILDSNSGGGRRGDVKIRPFHFSIILGSGFKSSLAHCKSVWPPFLISRFQVPLWRPFKNSGASTFLDSPFWLLLSRKSRMVSGSESRWFLNSGEEITSGNGN